MDKTRKTLGAEIILFAGLKDIVWAFCCIKEEEKMNTNIEINKKFGFWGTIQIYAKTEERTRNIWDLVLKRIKDLYSEKTEKEIVNFLNSRYGRHFADSLIDTADNFNLGLIMMRIAMLNKIKLSDWWAWYHGVTRPKLPIDSAYLYITAIKAVIAREDVQKEIKLLLNCAKDPIWKDPETWLYSEFTTANDLEKMWAYLQQKCEFNKGESLCVR